MSSGGWTEGTPGISDSSAGACVANTSHNGSKSILLLLLSFFVLTVKVVFGDVPTAYLFFRAIFGKSKTLKQWWRYVMRGKAGAGEVVKEVIHFGPYNYPLLMGKLSAFASVPYQIFDRTVNDTHRWLEDTDDSKTQMWLREQKAVTRNVMADTQAPSKIDDKGGLMESFTNKIQESSSYDDVDTVFQRGNLYFYFRSAKTDRGAENLRLFVTKSISADCFSGRMSRVDRMLLRQPDDLGNTCISGTWIDNDGEVLAYALASEADGDWMTIKVRDIESGEDYDDEIKVNCHRATTAVTWHNKRTGFFYSCFDHGAPSGAEEHEAGVSPNARHRVCFHRLNSSQEEDFVVYEDKEGGDNDGGDGDVIGSSKKRSIFTPRMSHDSMYLLLEVFEEQFESFHYLEGPTTCHDANTVNRLFFIEAHRFNGKDVKTLGKAVKLVDGKGGNYRWDYITNIEEDFWLRTNYCADQFRIVRISVPSSDTIARARKGASPDARLQVLSDQAWHTALEWIPETSDGGYLEAATIAAQTVMVLKYKRDLSNDIVLYDLTQSLNDVSRRPCAELPSSPYGVIQGPFSNFFTNSVFYSTTSFNDPGSIWRATITRSSVTHNVEVGFEPIFFRKVPNVDLYSYEMSQIDVPCKTHCSLDSSKQSRSDSSDSVASTGSCSPRKSQYERNQMHSRDPDADMLSLLLFHSKDYLDFMEDDAVAARAEANMSSGGGGSYSNNATSRASIRGSGSGKRPSGGASAAGRSSALGAWSDDNNGSAKNSRIQSRKSSIRDSMVFQSSFGKTTKPCLLYVHGSFGVSVMPIFSLPLLLYCKHFDAMLCVVNVRGGGEMGQEWAAKGSGVNKQHAVEDIITAAEHLVNSGYTSREQLGVISGNFGSSLVAAAINRSPDLFKAAVMEDGIFDLMRAEALSQPLAWYGNGNTGSGSGGDTSGSTSTSSTAKPHPQAELPSRWEQEIGCARRSVEQCDRMLSWSPVHNIRSPADRKSSFKHPSIMCVSHDDSPVPSQHSYKYVAELQRVWGVKGRGGPLLLMRQTDEEDDDDEVDSGGLHAPSSSLSFSQGNEGGGSSSKNSNSSVTALQSTAAALFFLATQTGCTYRDGGDDGTDSSDSD